MHVITYSPNFAPPHFAARGITKKHPTRHNGRSHCLLLYFVCLPLPDGAFFFLSIHKAHTFARPNIFCKVWKRNAVPMDKLLIPACTLARRECTNPLTYQVSSEGQLPVSVCYRWGMICQVI